MVLHCQNLLRRYTGRTLAAWVKDSTEHADESDTIRLMREQLKATATQGTEVLRLASRTAPPELKGELAETKEALKAVAGAMDALSRAKTSLFLLGVGLDRLRADAFVPTAARKAIR